jgi:hypothetical protein
MFKLVKRHIMSGDEDVIGTFATYDAGKEAVKRIRKESVLNLEMMRFQYYLTTEFKRYGNA